MKLNPAIVYAGDKAYDYARATIVKALKEVDPAKSDGVVMVQS